MNEIIQMKVNERMNNIIHMRIKQKNEWNSQMNEICLTRIKNTYFKQITCQAHMKHMKFGTTTRR